MEHSQVKVKRKDHFNQCLCEEIVIVPINEYFRRPRRYDNFTEYIHSNKIKSRTKDEFYIYLFTLFPKITFSV